VTEPPPPYPGSSPRLPASSNTAKIKHGKSCSDLGAKGSGVAAEDGWWWCSSWEPQAATGSEPEGWEGELDSNAQTKPWSQLGIRSPAQYKHRVVILAALQPARDRSGDVPCWGWHTAES
jgi:hypothetical protein